MGKQNEEDGEGCRLLFLWCCAWGDKSLSKYWFFLFLGHFFFLLHHRWEIFNFIDFLLLVFDLHTMSRWNNEPMTVRRRKKWKQKVITSRGVIEQFHRITFYPHWNLIQKVNIKINNSSISLRAYRKHEKKRSQLWTEPGRNNNIDGTVEIKTFLRNRDGEMS